MVGLGASRAFGKGSGEEDRVAAHQAQALEEGKDGGGAERQVDFLPYVAAGNPEWVSAENPPSGVLPRPGSLRLCD